MGAELITTRDPRSFIDPIPRGMDGLVLVDPADLAAAVSPSALVLYDVAIDENRPATQGDIDALVAACARGVKLRADLRAAVADAKAKDADVPLTAVEALLASVEAAPA